MSKETIFCLCCFGAAAILSGSACYLTDHKAISRNTCQRLSAESEKTLRADNRQVIGSPEAPYKIIEFMDYECLPCRSSSQTVETIVSSNPKQICLSIHHFPLPFHKNAKFAAIAAESAANQTDFAWVHYALLNSPNLEKKEIERLFQRKSIDMIKFEDACSSTSPIIVASDVALANTISVNATPTYFLQIPNGSIYKLSSLADLNKFFNN